MPNSSTLKFLWLFNSDGTWSLLRREYSQEMCRQVSYYRTNYPDINVRITNSHHPPRSITTPETECPF